MRRIQIKPEYSDLIRYGGQDDPLQEMPDSPPPDNFEFLEERNTRPINLKSNTEWGREIRRATTGS
ncbi:MAG: hypothetical protein A3G52_03775 [Candidatus Taylorbacteria bacterium RIFCSPLOWO2_12_FULL_43_20]|uniref:Uncharacterized protein n=1 Tax=Candidatus Taylorbacteria bacterium RIFCSPLOWO2_12_FULL_43_20 TaxID=1802332 RepID=A0A1G2P1R3_9BACT|nr:MAG: hypothetical protein A3B98_01550 [Candidatus Taylorbacteria bacterium RIFCSPHIGHO2_02_FULL_43_55]OHA29356.1 MAG: hypothetical protein A3E92_02345 [Candidatus Taylorbacteria bacterium RIFCSPHIGHO2_12_FULL_42_34]OHA31733.1 MAG: hypothetical protein A3B09_01790 [Candidatus Taylorbacteria bacterium RIFCSPLOWO2_01_FULL_43_83]OHA38784.1 MAG: hypothetical protein A3H58_01900 [Candidatus Taylorbacteria bacterium RIFCSPLOWO2_02_FULL_43_22b]OHA42287.1 MAG: hypothetical protein A3G52_03775 [Candid